MTARLDKLENRVNKNSGNSNKPPSSDTPYKKNPKRKSVKKRSCAKRGHKGHSQERMEPTNTVILKPQQCSCGNRHFPYSKPFYIHQVIELPDIQMEVTHFHLHTPVPNAEWKTRWNCSPNIRPVLV